MVNVHVQTWILCLVPRQRTGLQYLRALCQEYRERIREAEQQRRALIRQTDSLQADNKSLSGQWERASSQLAATQSQLSACQSQLATCQSQFSSAQLELDRRREGGAEAGLRVQLSQMQGQLIGSKEAVSRQVQFIHLCTLCICLCIVLSD